MKLLWVEAWVIQTPETKKPKPFKVLAYSFGAQERTRTSTVLPAST
jgi:hypothetical protein